MHRNHLLCSLILCSSFTAARAAPPELRTAGERSGYLRTGRYDEVERLCAAFPLAFPGRVRCEPFARTPEGRPMLALVASADGALTPSLAQQRRRPVLLFQGGIHAGEIDECEECSEPIGFRRLMARPMTTLCFDCKSAREQVDEASRDAARAAFDVPGPGVQFGPHGPHFVGRLRRPRLGEDALAQFRSMLALAYRLDLKGKGGAAHNRIGHIVIGARGASALRRHLGSVSSKVVAEAGCSVTVVRRETPDEPEES